MSGTVGTDTRPVCPEVHVLSHGARLISFLLFLFPPLVFFNFLTLVV